MKKFFTLPSFYKTGNRTGKENITPSANEYLKPDGFPDLSDANDVVESSPSALYHENNGNGQGRSYNRGAETMLAILSAHAKSAERLSNRKK